MKISLDGGETWAEAPNGVRILVENIAIRDDEGELHFNMTNEGVVTDVWVDGDNIGTESVMFDEKAEHLVYE